MTYGENAGVIRDELAGLLAQHRIQQRIGGQGSFRVPESTTVSEREELGAMIRRYRYATLTWCREALEAVSAKTDPHQATELPLTPLDELRLSLDLSLVGDVDDLDGRPLLELLAVDHKFDLLVRWQRIARAAALGEHDFTRDVNRGGLSPEQARIVAKDAADVIRGLVVLDRRYSLIPGWTPIPKDQRLNRAAENISLQWGDETKGLTVDARGWRPAPATITGPAAPGVAGAAQAQHNMLVDLTQLPNALNLRRLLYAQAQVSHEASRHAALAAPELAESFTEREQVYRTLVTQTRNVGGLIGQGGVAVAESHNTLDRLKRTPPGVDQRESLHELRRLFRHTDARLATTIERGFHDKVYFVSVKGPQLSDQQINGVYQQQTRFMPLSSQIQPDLLPTVRIQLCPASPPTQAATPDGLESRRTYEALTSHQPGVRYRGIRR